MRQVFIIGSTDGPTFWGFQLLKQLRRTIPFLTSNLFWVTLPAGLYAAEQLPELPTQASEAVQQLAVEPVWSGHPVGFCLLTQPPFQFVAYYDAQRRMSVAQRSLDSTNWTIMKLPSTVGWDSHNYVTLALDREVVIHASGSMRCVPVREQP